MKKYIIGLFGLLSLSVQAQWLTTGNSGLSSATNFLGTTDSVSLVFKTNNRISGLIGRSDNANVSFGYQSLLTPNQSYGNVAFGAQVLRYLTTGSNNVGFGYMALNKLTTGSENVAVGSYAMANSGVDVSYNVAVGTRALQRNIVSGNTAVGTDAAVNNTTGQWITVVGDSAMISNTTGSYNSAFGRYAMRNNTTGHDNVAMGYMALAANLAGNFNTAAGYGAMRKNVNGNENTAIGYDALTNGVFSTENVAVGARALLNAQSRRNTAVGWESLRSLSTGSNNTAFGYASMSETATGSGNVAVGRQTMVTNVSGSNNTTLGNYADVAASNLNNAIAIGYQAVATKSNTAVIGNNDMRTIGGKVGLTSFIDENQISFDLSKSIPGIELVRELTPVNYRVGTDSVQHTGFKVDDVKAAITALYGSGYDFNAIDYNTLTNTAEGLRYLDFLATLVKSVQQLSDRVEYLKEHQGPIVGTQTADQADAPYLEQNTPNPATSITTIAYRLPQTFKSAKIVVVDNAGRLVVEKAVQASGNWHLDCKNLNNGIYFYSLVVDASVIDTKKLILKK